MVATLRGTHNSVEISSTTVKVGRIPDNQLIINDTLVSGHHAQVQPQGGGYVVIDLNSMNGTFLNGQRLSPYITYPLHDGDTLCFGKTVFSFVDNMLQEPPTTRGEQYQPLPQNVYPPPQSKQPVSPPAQNGNQNKEQRQGILSGSDWVKIAGGLASLASIFAVIWGVYTYVHPGSPSSTPTPTPSIPRLHSSYNGTLTRLDNNTLISISMSSLNEDASGNFTAEGSDRGASGGGCPASFAGVVRADDTISFTLTETQVTNCGLVVTFKGQLFPDGHLAGDWQGPTSVEKGSWTIS